MIIENSEYLMRGNRVSPLNFHEVAKLASFFTKILNINKRTPSDLANFLERLPVIFPNLNIDIVDDDEWLSITEAYYDPENQTINLPNLLYNKAIHGDFESIAIIFHEIGHFFLGHKAILHHNSEPPKEKEDAEWQANTFSDCVMQAMKISSVEQFSFDF